MPTELLLLPSPVPSKCENKLSELLGCLLPLLFLFCPKRRAKLPLHASSSSTLEVTFASLDPHTCTIDCCCCLSKTQTHLHLDHLSSRRSEKKLLIQCQSVSLSVSVWLHNEFACSRNGSRSVRSRRQRGGFFSIDMANVKVSPLLFPSAAISRPSNHLSESTHRLLFQ